jgi:hypothetical protein
VFLLDNNKNIKFKFPQHKDKIEYSHDLVEPLIEANSYYKSFKVSEIIISADKDFKYIVDDKEVFTTKSLKISKFEDNDKRHYSLPIATFSPIMDELHCDE